MGLSGEPLGASWDPLGASWRPLGASWRPLGASWDQLLVPHVSLFPPGSQTTNPRGGFWEPKRLPKGTPSRAQDVPKSINIFNIEKAPLEDHRGASWADLGCFLVPSWGAKTLKNHWFSLVFSKIRFLAKIVSQEQSWSELEANLGSQELQNGGQEAPKTRPKIDQKNDQKKARFLRVPGGAPREVIWGGGGKKSGSWGPNPRASTTNKTNGWD